MSFSPVFLSFQNYKRFPSFRLDLSKDFLLISGQNGSGKTQLLWICLLFFDAFNKKVDAKTERKVSVTSIDLAILLCCEPFRSLGSFSSFVNKKDMNASSTFVPLSIDFSDGASTTIAVEFNGITSFHYEENFHPIEKIRFAFQSLGFHFCHWSDEKAQTNILTSASQNMRSLYKELEQVGRDAILKIMDDLFGIEKIEFTSKYELLIYEKGHLLQGNPPLEIMFCGSACQKVLSGLILLQTLISRPAPIKFFLIEETEALFYPSLAINYFLSVRNLCRDHNIRMILSTNCQEILATVGNDCKICLSLQFPGEKILEHTLHQLLGFRNTDSNPVLVCDGPHDKLFVENFMPEVYSKVHVMTSSAQLNNSYLLVPLHNASQEKILRLRDPEFLPSRYHSEAITAAKTKIFGKFPISLFFHEFNSAEGYFILNRILNDTSGEELLRLIDHLKYNPVALEDFKKGLDNAYGSYKDQIMLGSGQFFFEAFSEWMTLPDKVLKLREDLIKNPASSSSFSGLSFASSSTLPPPHSSVDPSCWKDYCDAVASLVYLVRGHSYVSNIPEVMKNEKEKGIHLYVQSRIVRLKDSLLQEISKQFVLEK